MSIVRILRTKKRVGEQIQLLLNTTVFSPDLITKNDFSLDEQNWRNYFLYQRLPLVIGIAFFCVASFALLSLSIHECTNASELCESYNLVIEAAIAIYLIGCLALHRSKFGKNHPGVVFLATSWSITLVDQILLTLVGAANEQVWFWTLVFLTQAIFIPVRWRLHLISQLGVLVYFFVVNVGMGLVEARTLSYLPTVPIYIAWICLICNLGIYLYERLKSAELESRREIQLFLHAVSHDLRNPVTGMVLTLSSLLENHRHAQPESDTVPVPRRVIERMIQGSDRQLNLIDSLLETYGNKVQGLAIKLQPLQLSSLVADLIAELKPLISKNRATISNYISDELPLIQGDPHQLWRVLQNLIANAFNHNPPGVNLTISAKAIKEKSEKKFIRCQIQDDGVGMSSQQCQQLFKHYFQRYSKQRNVSLGLGLYLCRQIINAHGGKIGVISNPGSGTTFWFTLLIK